MSNARAAEMMELSVKAFESLLLRARSALRQRIEACGISLADWPDAAGEAA
jgi:DNA-directed RNA polymerase specialized sigma24 family protein